MRLTLRRQTGYKRTKLTIIGNAPYELCPNNNAKGLVWAFTNEGPGDVHLGLGGGHAKDLAAKTAFVFGQAEEVKVTLKSGKSATLVAEFVHKSS